MAEYGQSNTNAGNMAEQYDIERQEEPGAFSNGSAQGAGPQGIQGNRVTFQDQMNEPMVGQGEGEVDMSEQQPLDEEETDIVHDLHEAPVSATLIQGNLVERDNIIGGIESGGAPINPFSDGNVGRVRQFGGSGARTREFEMGNLNEIEQDMDQYS